MKYIMIQTADGEKLPIIFPERLVHKDVADIMRRVVGMSTAGQLGKALPQVVSAGFVEFTSIPSVAGVSESLGELKHNPLDGFRIKFGAAVSHMPDELLAPLMTKLEAYQLADIDDGLSADAYRNMYLCTPDERKADELRHGLREEDLP